MMKLTTFKRMTAIAMSVMMAFSGITASPNSIAASKPTIAKKATISVGAKKSLTIKANGYTIKTVKVTSSSKKVTVKSSKKAITVTGVKAGTATITTTLKALKGKKKIKTFKYTTTVTVKKAKIDPTPTPDVAVEVSTQEELTKALANSKLTNLTIEQAVKSLEIPEGTYDKVDLVVDAPDATIVNYGTFKSIEIKAVAADTYIEKGKGNNISVTAKKAVHIIVDTLNELLSLVFGSGTNQSNEKNKVEIKNGNVDKIEVSDNSNVDMKVQNSATVNSVDVKEGSNVKIEAANQAQINNVNISGDGTKADITSDGNSKVDTVKVGEGGPEAIISGDSKNKITLDIKDANAGAKATVNTDNVKVSTDSNTVIKDVVNNQSGKAIETEIVKPDGTTESGTKPADGSSGVKPSEPSSGGESNTPSAPSSYTVTLDLDDDANARAASISETDLTAAGFTASGNRKWVKTYNAGVAFGNIPRPTLSGKQFITWGYSDVDQGVLANDTVSRSCTLQSVFADEIRVKYCFSSDGGLEVSSLPDAVNNATVSTATNVAAGTPLSQNDHMFKGWGLGGDDTIFTTANTIGEVVSHVLTSHQAYDWEQEGSGDEAKDICVISLYSYWESEDDLIKEAINNITFDIIKGANASADSVTSDLSLPTTVEVNSDTKEIGWELDDDDDDSAFINPNTGVITQGEEDNPDVKIRAVHGDVVGNWITFTILGITV